jgi:hypothetical protein
VTNVDSQGSDTNIVIQVIGEMSNKSQPHRKFVQTFVLAAQTNGYFVLNDIFRYIKEDDDDEEVDGEVPEQETHAPVGGLQEPVPTAVDSALGTELKETVQNDEEVAEVDKKLEEVKQEEEQEEAAPAVVNGTPVPESAEVTDTEEAPAATVSAPETQAEAADISAVQDDLESEKPKDPVATPTAEPAQPATAPAAPPKPAVPRTWAQLASGNRTAATAATATAAAAPTATVLATRQASAATQPKPSAPAPASAQPTSTAPSAPSAPPRETSPDSNKDGSTGGWQTAGAEHTRKQSRAHNAPAVSQDGRVRAFVKNVTEDVEAEALKSLLSKFGELVYFDVSRPKVCSILYGLI